MTNIGPRRITYQDIVDRKKPEKLLMDMSVWVIYSSMVRSGIVVEVGETGAKIRLRNQDIIPVARSHIRERLNGDSRSSSISARRRKQY